MYYSLAISLLLLPVLTSSTPDFPFRQCESIRIEMCRGIGYNETAMPNLVGHELQAEVAYVLETFVPLIEYVCSTQLKLFLCVAYVPMCTPKVPVPIGPCRSLCESVRAGCNPVLQGFGFSWPPALDCNRFPKENNNETMCMEGPGEAHPPMHKNDDYPAMGSGSRNGYSLKCPGYAKSQLYVKLHRSGRCAPYCDADILFTQDEKHLAEVWVEVWSYSALSLALVATLCITLTDDSKQSLKWFSILVPLVWCHDMVAIGWTVRFVSGRSATACGYDPQLPNVSLLLIDGLSNPSCAATFLLRYYFGMAACAWWAILCLGWHRELRCNSPDANGQLEGGTAACTLPQNAKRTQPNSKPSFSVTQSNLSRFVAWGLPAFQTVAVIVARLVDADELLGVCFVGNQSDKGLQVLVATPFFCYWIFGSMNLISGYLVHRRNNEILRSNKAAAVQRHHAPHHFGGPATTNSGIGIFLFFYSVPFGLLLLAVIYEFANIDIWLNAQPHDGVTTPLWPFLMRVFMELMLGIICFAWVLGPKISIMYKRQLTPQPAMKKPTPSASSQFPSAQSSRSSNVAYSTVSYHTIRLQPHQQAVSPARFQQQHQHTAGSLAMTQIPKYAASKNKGSSSQPRPHLSKSKYKKQQQLYRYGNETIL